MDLSKPFDLINHELLVENLHDYGFKYLYIENR